MVICPEERSADVREPGPGGDLGLRPLDCVHCVLGSGQAALEAEEEHLEQRISSPLLSCKPLSDMVYYDSIPWYSVTDIGNEGGAVKIKQLPSGRWLVRISYQEDGVTREVSKTFSKRRDAEKWQRHHEVARDTGTLQPPSRQTVGAYLVRWLRDLTGIGGRTREDYENIVRRYLGRTREECDAITRRYGLSPAVGVRRLDQLNRAHLREWIGALTRHGLAPRTVAYARAVLRRALNQAVSDGELLRNPAAGDGLVPKQERGEQLVLSAVQVNRLLDQTRDDPAGALWAVLLTGGLRLSEALALRWTDTDLDRRELRVMRKLRRPKNGAGWLVEECKTDKSHRAVPLLPTTVEALARHRDRQAVERLVAGEGYRDHGFVFADAQGEPLRGDGVTKYAWRPMLARLKLPPVKLHGARHTAATLLLEAGQPMKVVQEMLGHSSMAVTSDLYSHVTPAFARQAADALAEYLERAE
jgi:integrase